MYTDITCFDSIEPFGGYKLQETTSNEISFAKYMQNVNELGLYVLLDSNGQKFCLVDQSGKYVLNGLNPNYFNNNEIVNAQKIGNNEFIKRIVNNPKIGKENIKRNNPNIKIDPFTSDVQKQLSNVLPINQKTTKTNNTTTEEVTGRDTTVNFGNAENKDVGSKVLNTIADSKKDIGWAESSFKEGEK